MPMKLRAGIANRRQRQSLLEAIYSPRRNFFHERKKEEGSVARRLVVDGGDMGRELGGASMYFGVADRLCRGGDGFLPEGEILEGVG